VRTHHVVEADTPALKKDLAREPVHKGEPELEHKERDERKNLPQGGTESKMTSEEHVVLYTRGPQPLGRGPVPVHGLVGTGPRKKVNKKSCNFLFLNQSEKYIILKKERIHPSV